MLSKVTFEQAEPDRFNLLRGTSLLTAHSSTLSATLGKTCFAALIIHGVIKS